MDTIINQLKAIEEREKALAAQRKQLEAELEQSRKREAKLEKLFESSGYKTPRDLVSALITKYNIRAGSLKTSKNAEEGKKRRSRTIMTVELRDKLKQEIEQAGSVNAVSKQHGISYSVVSKVWNGFYDEL